jgi:hypothetical protein
MFIEVVTPGTCTKFSVNYNADGACASRKLILNKDFKEYVSHHHMTPRPLLHVMDLLDTV